MYCMFSDAAENDIIAKNPVTKSVKYDIGKESKEARALTIEEQKKFLEIAKNTSNYNQFAFILQTGLRTGELIGLRWSDVDFENKLIHVREAVHHLPNGQPEITSTKTEAGIRTIPCLIHLLKNCGVCTVCYAYQSRAN